MLPKLLDQLIPPLCISCRCNLIATGDDLCESCLKRIYHLNGGLCEGCGLPQPCKPCITKDTNLKSIGSLVSYEETAVKLIRRLKYQRSYGVADLIAKWLAERFGDQLTEGVTLVPVPQTHLRRCQRGYNQTELIATKLGRLLRLEVAQILERRDYGSQIRRSRSQRLYLPAQQSYICTKKAPKETLIIDDVCTSGGTLLACSEALTAAGCESVKALTFARTLRGRFRESSTKR